jgi:hypothetical protein
MSQHDEWEIGRFFTAIADWGHLYSGSLLSFIALKFEEKLVLHRAQVLLVGQWNSEVKELGLFETDRLVVGHVFLSTAGLTAESLVESLRIGRATICGREFEFPREPSGSLSATYMEFDPEGASNNRRLPKLILTGQVNGPYPEKMSLDWHLRPMAFDSVDDLCATYQLGAPDLHRPMVEITAAPVAEMHSSSGVTAGAALLAIGVPADADRSAASISYKVFGPGGLERRGVSNGSGLTWHTSGPVAVGSTQLAVSGGAAIQCFACFEGRAHHANWLGDVSYSPNLRRLIFEGVDEGLEVIKDFLFEEKRPRKEARDLEFGVAWLLWMAGFAVLHPGTKRLEDNADLIALTSSSQILLVECTTGLLSREGKIPNLLHRAATLKKRLLNGGFEQASVLGLGVTTKHKDEVAADIRESAKAGILLLTKDDLTSVLTRTLAPMNGEAMFKELQKHLEQFEEPFG